jgi:hypothetical protein
MIHIVLDALLVNRFCFGKHYTNLELDRAQSLEAPVSALVQPGPGAATYMQRIACALKWLPTGGVLVTIGAIAAVEYQPTSNSMCF